MESTHRRRVIRIAASLLSIVVSASAVFWLSPSVAQQLVDDALCRARLSGIGDVSPACRDNGSKHSMPTDANEFNYASALALQFHARYIGDVFGSSHR